MGGAVGAETESDESRSVAFVVDAEQRIQQVTPHGATLTQGQDRAVLGATIEDLSGPLFSGETADRYREALERIETEQPARFRTTIQHREGCPTHYQVWIEQFDDAVRWSMAERPAFRDAEDLMAAISDAAREIAAQDSSVAVTDTLDERVRTLLAPTGVTVRESTDSPGTYRRLRDDHGTPVDSTAVVSVADSPYSRLLDPELLAEGEAVVERGIEDLQDAAFEAVAACSLGEAGTVIVSRIGRGFSPTERHVLSTLAATAGAALEASDRQAQIDRQTVTLDRYRTLIESIPHPVYTTDDRGTLTYANEAFQHQFGYDADEEKHISAFMSTDSTETLRERLAELIEVEESAATLSLEGVRADGRKRQFAASVNAVSRGDGLVGTVGVLRDVTDRRRREEITRVMNRALRHNLRTSTNNIMGYAEVTEQQVSGDLAEYMQIIQEESSWLMKLGNTLREIRRSTQQSIAETPVIDIEALVEPVVFEYRQNYPGATIKRAYNTTGRIEGGATLRRAVANVVENAIVHNDAANPAVDIRVTDGPQEDQIDVRIEDDGPGIPQHEIDTIVGETEITQLQHSTGIGLWIVQWLVEVFDGEMLFDVGESGSVVALRLRKVSR
jgi:PAS domain S-box-containing protein